MHSAAIPIEPHRGETARRRILRTDMALWARAALPRGQRPAAHHLLLIQALDDIRAGRCDRLMVLMPPGSAKSTYGSVLFPPWWFAHHPDSQVIAAAHTSSLAGEFGGRVRALVAEHTRKLGYGLAGAKARHDFKLSNGGSYYAVGVHGAVTGRRADLILIDDPVRSHEDADSEVRRDALWNWYRSDLLTRLKPGGRIVLIMTRWHEDDLGGRLLGQDPGWRCLRLPALAEPGDPLGRVPGAALWPEWEDSGQIARKRSLMGDRAFSALFQQNPRPQEGALFKPDAIATLADAAPLHTVRAWDLAATASADADWTVGLKLGREASGRFVVLDIVRLQGSSHSVVEAMRRTAQLDGTSTLIALPQDPGQAGKHQAQFLTGQLAGYRVVASPETGSKQTRAMPVASQVEAGNLTLLRAGWNTAFRSELAEFPFGRKDDQVDALSRAFAELTQMSQGPRQTSAHFMGR